MSIYLTSVEMILFFTDQQLLQFSKFVPLISISFLGFTDFHPDDTEHPELKVRATLVKLFIGK